MEIFCLENSLFMMKISPPNEFSGVVPGKSFRLLLYCFGLTGLQDRARHGSFRKSLKFYINILLRNAACLLKV
jgi:hypothetical protein